MRQLRLHRTSMPKGSPDDNPAETIFSDIQQNILDNSDDPDKHARPKVASARPFASAKWRAGPVHSHSLPGGYSQKLGDKFAQGFCDATVKARVHT